MARKNSSSTKTRKTTSKKSKDDQLEAVISATKTNSRVIKQEFKELNEKVGLVGESIKRSDDKEFEFAKLDYAQVHRDIIDIKRCRSNIFTGTLGVVSAVGVGILGLVGKGTASGAEGAWEDWMMVASLVPIFLLTSAILSTVHIARGVTMRTGYLEALADWIRHGQAPPFYKGWHRAIWVTKRCDLIRKKIKNIRCVRKYPKGCEAFWGEFGDTACVCSEEKECFKVAKDLAKQLDKYERWRPDLLNSFTSMATYIYGFAYIIAFLCLLWAIMVVTKKEMIGFNRKMYVVVVLVGALTSGGFAFAAFSSKVRAEKKRRDKNGECPVDRKETRVETCFRLVSYFMNIFVMPIFFISYLVVQVKGWRMLELGGVAYLLGASVAIFAVSMCYFCYDRVDSLRRGRYSPERWRHIWKIRLMRCPLMVEDTCWQRLESDETETVEQD